MSIVIILTGPGQNPPPPPPPPTLLWSPDGTIIVSGGVTYGIFKGPDAAAHARDYFAGLVD